MWRAILFIVTAITSTNGCIRRESTATGNDYGHYCVCNATYCDKTPDISKPHDLTDYVLITSSKAGLRFHVLRDVYGNTVHNNDSMPLGKITINQTDVYQNILGFGGAVTDAASFNIKNLSETVADELMRSYFGPDGIGYTFIRTPMGGSDFSLTPYSYAMTENDTLLQDFHLPPEEHTYKIPIIKRAVELSKNEMKLMTVPWSASPWMKTNNDWWQTGSIRPEYRQLWADYFVKYFQAYRRVDLEFWGVATQNEPANHMYINWPFISMAWTAEEERDWIIECLSPALKKAGFGNIKIFIADENRLVLPDWPKTVLHDERARNIVSGIAVHWYMDDIIRPSVLDEVRQLFPDKLLLYTEACTGVTAEQRVILGSWQRGEAYASSIIENMLHWVSTWIDWNIALDTTGGPNWLENYVDSPIIVNATADEFYKQPMFYVLGHFSKYVPPNSVRIGTTSEGNEGIESVAFYTPDEAVVLVILNLNEEERGILIEDLKKGITKINVPGKSISTMKYW